MRAIHILLVEDNEGDILLTTEVLTESKFANRVSVVKNGRDAITFLMRIEEFAHVDAVDLILLDINLPFKNGLEVLAYIKSKAELRHLPVIMLTTSSSEVDILQSYKHHANCYITKPVEIDEFILAVTSIEQFWLSIVSLPSGGAHG